VKLAARGDEDAFAALYHRHKHFAMAIAWRYVRDREAAADIVQDAFIYLIRKLPTLTLTSRMTTYLYPVVKNIALTSKRRKTMLSLGDEGGSDAQESTSPSASHEGAADFSIETVVELLPEHQREVLLLRFVDDLSMEEIALCLSIPVGTVKSRLHLALRTLREHPKAGELFQDNQNKGNSSSD
jgi:RNA polymerase sigma-70 factor (ECF subfamily)